MNELLRLRNLVRPYWPRIILAFVFLLSLTAIDMIIPYIIQQVIDVGLVEKNVAFLTRAALIILAIAFVRGGLPFGVRYLSESVAANVGYDLRNRLYDHIQRLSFSFHDHSQAGQLISRCIEDARSIERFTGFSVVELIRVSILMVGISIILFLERPTLALLALLPLIPLMWLTMRFGRKVSGIFFRVDVTLGELSSRLQENVSGVQVVRAFAREPYEMDRFESANKEHYNARVDVITEFAKVMPTTNLLVALSTILILWFGGQMVLQGELTIGELVAFNSYVLMLAAPVQQLTWLVNSAGEAVAGIQRAFEILDTVPLIKSPPDAYKPSVIEGRVEYKNVSFAYSSEKAQALTNINLTVEPNQVVAIIGATGSGKSSFINLIPRFYDVSEGAVLVDGQDVRKYNLTMLRRQIGIVLQTSFLFSVTIHENIAFGRSDASREDVIAAAKAAQAHEFILGMPEGYDTIVGERGVTLSGGQRQRVAIARALLMDPRILILDDSTSSVDTQTERLIQQALDHLMEGRTTFVIAHRLSTVRRADMILVLDGGKVIEQGKHDELLALNGLYREIHDLQLRDQGVAVDKIGASSGKSSELTSKKEA